MKLHGRSVLVIDGNFDRALRKFKKKVADSGLLQDLRDREAYEKPTTRRKKARASAERRWKKKLADQQLPKKLF